MILSLSFPPGEEKTLSAIKKIAQSKSRSRSFVIIEACKEYLANDKNGGNHLESAAYGLDFTGAIGTSELRNFSWKEEDEMIQKLERTISAIKNDRQAKRDEEMRAKGLRPKA